MRVWLAPSSYAPNLGGVEEHTARLAAGLRDRGDEVLVLVNRWPAHLPPAQTIAGVPVLRLDMTQPGRDPRRLMRHLRARRSLQAHLNTLPVPDILHLHCLSSQTSHLSTYSSRHGVPLVLTTHGETAMDASQAFDRDPFLRAAVRQACTRAAALTACSAWAAQHAASVAPPFAGAHVVHNGAPITELAGLPDISEPVFVAFGRHVAQKGFDLLLDAWPAVLRVLPSARLLLAGSGPDTATLTARQKAGVEMLGPLDRAGVRSLLGRARTVVVPSRIEPFGIVAREALVAGRRLVHSDTGGLSEAAAGLGRPFATGDPVDLARAMLLAHADDRPRLRQKTLSEWDWSGTVSQYVSLYHGLLVEG